MTHTVQVSTPEWRGAGWFVPSARMPGVGYHVRRVHGAWVRQCASHRWRRHTLCRHVQAVIRMQREGGRP